MRCTSGTTGQIKISAGHSGQSQEKLSYDNCIENKSGGSDQKSTPTLVPIKKDLINDFNMASNFKGSQLKDDDGEEAFNMIVGCQRPDAEDVEMQDN